MYWIRLPVDVVVGSSCATDGRTTTQRREARLAVRLVGWRRGERMGWEEVGNERIWMMDDDDDDGIVVRERTDGGGRKRGGRR